MSQISEKFRGAPGRAGNRVAQSRGKHAARVDRYNSSRFLGPGRWLELRLESPRELHEDYIRDIVNHAGAELRQKADDVDFRNRRYLRTPIRQSAQRTGHLHGCATFASDVLTLALQLHHVGIFIQPEDMEHALVIGDAGPDFYLNGALEGTIIHGLGDFGAWNAIGYPAGIAQQI